MSPKEIELFTQLTHAPPLLIGALGLGDRFPPYSTVISNVPGPRERLLERRAARQDVPDERHLPLASRSSFALLSNADQ
ncbi:MAG: hypothetical protein R3B82_08355 [Sandaracinaceae bacterium]